MAIGLNKDMKGTIMELISVMRTCNRLEPVEISTAAGERALFDSLVFANVARMAKYGRVSNSGDQMTDCSNWCLALTEVDGVSP
jgi:hypothetical protein